MEYNNRLAYKKPTTVFVIMPKPLQTYVQYTASDMKFYLEHTEAKNRNYITLSHAEIKYRVNKADFIRLLLDWDVTVSTDYDTTFSIYRMPNNGFNLSIHNVSGGIFPSPLTEGSPEYDD